MLSRLILPCIIFLSCKCLTAEQICVNNFKILDSQFFNPHLVQFGAYEIESSLYEQQLKESLEKESLFQNIENFQEVLLLIQSTNQRS